MWKIVEAHGDWALRFPDEDNVVFGQVISGACQLELQNRQPIALHSGDFLLMTAPSSWILRNGRDVDPLNFDSVYAGPSQAVTLVGVPEDVPVTRFIAGHFNFAPAHPDLLARHVPGVIHIRSTDVAASRVGHLLALIGDEATSQRPGRSLILGRLVEVMLVEALRHESSVPERLQGDLLAGLADPKIAPALREMHGDVRRHWTVGTLAKQVGMSRAAFAARFTRTVGMAPIDYLLRWRIALAKDALRSSNLALAEIAAMVCYQSVSAFSTAFSRIAGYPPARYRQYG